MHVHVCLKVFTWVFMSAFAWVFVCVFVGRVVSAYAFMSAVGVSVCECVPAYCRACVNFVLNATYIYSKSVA